MNQGTTVVFGGQTGSEAKGAIVGRLAREHSWGASICSFMTNAGHTWIADNGEKVMVQQIPMAVVGPEVGLLLIGPGSAITLDILFEEIRKYDVAGWKVSDRLRVHPRAMIIEHDDVMSEMTDTKYVASTMKGCGRALARKVQRAKTVRLARDIPALKPFLADTSLIVNDLIDDGRPVLVEGSQGFDLDINHGLEYPYCTSRGCTPSQVLADCGLSGSVVARTVAVIRTYPIRVGNVTEQSRGGAQTQTGYSGPMGGTELTWEEITKRSGSPVPLEERTTVTKRVRRIFEQDVARLAYMCQLTRPTEIALTFADYIDHRLAGKNTDDLRALTKESPDTDAWTKLAKFIASLAPGLSAPVTMVKTGPRDGQIIEGVFSE